MLVRRRRRWTTINPELGNYLGSPGSEEECMIMDRIGPEQNFKVSSGVRLCNYRG